jgi:hypothetical protein
MALTLVRLNVRPLNGAIVRPYTLASAGNIGDWVYPTAADKVAPARGNAIGTVYAIGIIVSIEGYMPGTAAVAEQTVGVCVFGPVSGFTGMDPVNPFVFIDAAVAGVGTQTAPTGGSNRVYAGGRAIRGDILFVCPQMTPATAGA